MKFMIETVTLLSIVSLVLGVPWHIREPEQPQVPSGIGCEDIRSNCAEHAAAEGYCDYNRNFTEINCRKTCKFCEPKQPQVPSGIGCEDIRSNCAEHAAAEGYCVYNRKFMEENCRKTCGFCEPEQPRVPSGIGNNPTVGPTFSPLKLSWANEPWNLCKDGKQWRSVKCIHKYKNEFYQVAIKYCEERLVEDKPKEERSC